ncbi:hypothetical protein M0R45_024017 [Rubus argutus]|uniref:Agglutinin domain-containing protein n=1 Tax=Rubus argutus TaxID=59490 RepID=A0AAW1WPX2_RUBAR
MAQIEVDRTENPSDEITLPRFVVLKSNHNNKYLSYTNISEENVDQVPTGFLKFSGEEVGSHYAKFEVEMAKSCENKGLVHIRCCYNNKYWVRLLRTNTPEDDHWIVAKANEPEEDRSKSSCTLFEPIITVEELNDPVLNEEDDNDAISDGENDVAEQHQVHNDGNGDDEEDNDNDNDNDNEHDNNNRRVHAGRNRFDRKRMLVRLRHVQLGHYTRLWKDNENIQHLMGGLSTSPDNNTNNNTDVNSNNTDESSMCDVCTVIDWGSLVIFPKHVAFKGDNGAFLTSDWRGWNANLEYEGEDFRGAQVAHEIFTNPDGSIRIKSDNLGKFWCRRPGDPDWILPDSDDPTRNDTLFQPIKIDDNEFALRNMGNFNICKRYTLGCMVGFTANVPNIPIFAHLRIEEVVRSRIVYNVSYRLMQARIYDYQNEIEIATGEAVNLTQETTGMTFKLPYKNTKRVSWNDARTLSMKSGGVKTTMQAGVPMIGEDGKLAISSSGFNCGSTIIKWGEVETWETAVQNVCKVVVPAMTTVEVSLIANRASYEVPFNYSRRDTRTNGQISNNDMDDGIYTGFNFFNFNYNIKQKNL